MERQLFGEDDTCLECFSSRLKNPILELNFTSCCGRAICTPCKRIKFKKKTVVPCGTCGTEIKESSVGKDNLDAQRFESGKRAFNTVASDNLQLDRSYFDSDAKYNDYLEEVQDLVYLSVYGDQSQGGQTEINKKKRKLKKMVEQLYVLKSKSVDLDRQHRDQIRKEGGGAGLAAQPTYSFAHEEAGPMPLTSESFDEIRARKRTEDESLRAKVKALPAEKLAKAKSDYRYTKNVQRTLAKLAGGFHERYNRERNLQAAFGELHR